MDIRLALMCGSPLPFVEAGLVIHQPTIEEISMVGEEDFFIGVQCFCIDKNQFTSDKNILSQITNFQLFMKVMNDKDSYDKKEAVIQYLSLLFPSYKISFTPRSILIMNQENSGAIDENTFDAFQNLVKEMCNFKSNSQDQTILNPSDKRAKEIADKIMRGRQRLAEEKGQTNISIFSQYSSILSIGLHIPLGEVKKYTMFQVYDQIERYKLYIDWDIDLKSRLAGGKPDGQPENWMKNIH